VHAVIVVPCYNEEHRLDSNAFRDYSLEGHRVEFCFVNDGSRDRTLALLEQLRAVDPARFFVVNLERNRGKAEAVRQGVAAMIDRRPDVVGFWDADLATPLSELASFIEILEHPAVEMVLAARVRLLGRSISRRPSRHYVGRVGATLISQTLGLAVYDTQCGAKLFRVNDTTREIFSRPFLSRWLFDVEILARFVERRGRDAAAAAIYELPIRVWRDVQGSKVKSTDFVKALRDLWKIRRAYRIQR
jgi:glycosyltransferase involved in cell wall biosynthesis